MSGRVQVKSAAAGALIAVAIIGSGTVSEWTLALLAFGIWNVVVAVEGTLWVRAITVGAVAAALLWPEWLFTPVALLAWLVWPPASRAFRVPSRRTSSEREIACGGSCGCAAAR